MEITSKIISKLWFMQSQSGYKEFFKIFSNPNDDIKNEYSLASHLWKKYVDSNHNILRLWNQLDNINQSKLLVYLDSYEFIKRYKKGMCIN